MTVEETIKEILKEEGLSSSQIEHTTKAILDCLEEMQRSSFTITLAAKKQFIMQLRKILITQKVPNTEKVHNQIMDFIFGT